VAVAATKSDKTLAEQAEHFTVHPNHISEWKQQLMESAAGVFGVTPRAKAVEPDFKTRHAKVGQLTPANYFLVPRRLEWVSPLEESPSSPLLPLIRAALHDCYGAAAMSAMGT